MANHPVGGDGGATRPRPCQGRSTAPAASSFAHSPRSTATVPSRSDALFHVPSPDCHLSILIDQVQGLISFAAVKPARSVAGSIDMRRKRDKPSTGVRLQAQQATGITVRASNTPARRPVLSDQNTIFVNV
jgi:hypothetical protein